MNYEGQSFQAKNKTVEAQIMDEFEKKNFKRLEEERIKNILAARQFLYSIGFYELEEGEILE